MSDLTGHLTEHERSLDIARRLGRIEAGLDGLLPHEERLFALALAMAAVTAGLRCHGHRFTDARRALWFAGVTTIADIHDAQSAPLWSARAIARSVASALAVSPWEPMAKAGMQIETALMAVADEAASAGGMEDCMAAVEAANVLLEEANLGRRGMAGLVADIGKLFDAGRKNEVFATPERAIRSYRGASFQGSFEAERERQPYWALDVLAGRHLSELATWRALPCPGLCGAGVLKPRLEHDPESDMDDDEILLGHVEAVLGAFERSLDAGRAAALQVRQAESQVKTSSSLPALMGLLAVMGELRSTQIERLLGLTRLGVRAVVQTGMDLGLLAARKEAGIRLVSLAKGTGPSPALRVQEPGRLVISEAVAQDVDDALAFADRLNARYGDKQPCDSPNDKDEGPFWLRDD